jgi:hypothetical protein
MHALRTILVAVGATTLLAAAPAAAHPPSAHVGVEPVYFDGQTLQIIQASATSSNPNQAFFACYPLGPDLSASNRSAASPTMYVVLAPGATQHSCADGSLTHDHVLSTAPGNAGYTGAWTAILAVPGPFFGAADMPITSVSELDAAVAAGQLVLIDPGVDLLAPVLAS